MTFRTTSRPTKSASSSGPIGWFSPTFAPVSMSSAVAVLLLEHPHRLGQERHQDPIDDEPGPVGRDDQLLAELAGELADRRSVSSVGREPRMSSTSGITGHRAGRSASRRTARAARARPPRPAGDRDRARVRREDRIGRRALVELAPQRALHPEVLEHRLDDEVGADAPARGRPGDRHRGEHASRSSAVSLPFGRPPGRGCPRSDRGPPRAREARARTGRRACRSRHGPGRCRGP